MYRPDQTTRATREGYAMQRIAHRSDDGHGCGAVMRRFIGAQGVARQWEMERA